jgi:hypothetical protein
MSIFYSYQSIYKMDKQDEIFEKEEPKVKVVKQKKPLSNERLEKLRNQLVLAREARKGKKSISVASISKASISVASKPVDEPSNVVKDEVVKKEVVKEEPVVKEEEPVVRQRVATKKRIYKSEVLLNELNALKLEIKEMKNKKVETQVAAKPQVAAKTAPVAKPFLPSIPIPVSTPYSLFKTAKW